MLHFCAVRWKKKLKLNLLAETNESGLKSSEEESDEGLGDEIDEEDKNDSKSKSKPFDQIENQSVVFNCDIQSPFLNWRSIKS